MKDSTDKSSFGDFQEFIEDGSLTLNNNPSSDKQIDKNELEERRIEMLKDNTLEKYNSYIKKTNKNKFIDSGSHLKVSRDKSADPVNNQKHSFKMFQAMTIGDTSYMSNLNSFVSLGGSRGKPKIFEILK
jgi:hypothetical protein